MVSIKSFFFWIAMLWILISCENSIKDDYYNKHSDNYVEESVLSELNTNPDYSVFLSWMEETGLKDSLLNLNQPITLFVPRNEAFQGLDTAGFTKMDIVSYHILLNTFLPSHINGGSRNFITLNHKIANIKKNGNVYTRDGVEFFSSNKLFTDGVIYTIDDVLIPSPTVYDYWLIHTPVLAKWYREQDSLAFDIVNSTAIGFDSIGNTVYDSVFTTINRFDVKYYKVADDNTYSFASFLVFTQEQYDEALNDMAKLFGGTGAEDDYKRIPAAWQNEIFIPTMMENAVYAGEINYDFFNQAEIDVVNINNQPVSVNPLSVDKNYLFKCSNGLIFRYSKFEVPDSLYRMERKYEGESFLQQSIDGNWIWDELIAKSNKPALTLNPTVISNASGGKCATVQFKKQTDSEGYHIDFTLTHVFAGEYVLKIYQYKSPACKFDLYVNGEKKMEQVDNSAYYRKPGGFYYAASDISVAEFGNVAIRIEYDSEADYIAAPGINIDYFELNLK